MQEPDTDGSGDVANEEAWSYFSSFLNKRHRSFTRISCLVPNTLGLNGPYSRNAPRADASLRSSNRGVVYINSSAGSSENESVALRRLFICACFLALRFHAWGPGVTKGRSRFPPASGFFCFCFLVVHLVPLGELWGEGGGRGWSDGQ